MRTRWISRSICAASLLCLLSPGHTFADAGGIPADRIAAWTEEEVEFLATAREREKLRELTGESEREMFMQGFWQARDPYPQTPRNELREEWESRMQTMHQRWGSLQDDRSRVFLLQGEPTTAFAASCPGSGTFEVWVYEPRFRAKYRTVLIFQGDGAGAPARLWQPGPGAIDLAAIAATAAIATDATDACTNRDKLAEEAKMGPLGRDGALQSHDGAGPRQAAPPRMDLLLPAHHGGRSATRSDLGRRTVRRVCRPAPGQGGRARAAGRSAGIAAAGTDGASPQRARISPRGPGPLERRIA